MPWWERLLCCVRSGRGCIADRASGEAAPVCRCVEAAWIALAHWESPEEDWTWQNVSP